MASLSMTNVSSILSDIERGDPSEVLQEATLEVAVCRPARGLAHGPG
jgi:hypothetical protein